MHCQMGNICLLTLVHLSPWNPSEKINLIAGSKPLSEPNSSSLPAENSSPFTKIEGLYRTTELYLIKLALRRLHRAASFLLTPWQSELAAAIRNELPHVSKTQTFAAARGSCHVHMANWLRLGSVWKTSLAKPLFCHRVLVHFIKASI